MKEINVDKFRIPVEKDYSLLHAGSSVCPYENLLSRRWNSMKFDI